MKIANQAFRNTMIPSGRLFPNHGVTRKNQRRGGAVIIIVLSLMAALAFLGFFFYEFTVLERSTAEQFSEIGSESASAFDPEPQFDDALEQLIVGTRRTHLDSALYGNRYSMLATLIGQINPDGLVPYDVNSHSGSGVQIRFDDNEFSVNSIDGNSDGDFFDAGDTLRLSDGRPDDTLSPTVDGIPDRVQFIYGAVPADPELFAFVDDNAVGNNGPNRPVFNYSRAANPDNVDGGVAYTRLPFPYRSLGAAPALSTVPDYAPDAGYTYPDINSMFLGYRSEYVKVNQPIALFGPGNPNRVEDREIFIPSFCRPQYFADRRAGNSGGFTTIYENGSGNADDLSGDTRALVLRPHAEHARFSSSTGQVTGNRFLSTFAVARSGDATRRLRPFPFRVDSDNDGNVNERGIFSAGFGDLSINPEPGYDLDVDTDNNGQDDAILMDLDLPIISFSDGRQAVPLVAFQVLDADGLINVNTSGNLTGLARMSKELDIDLIGPLNSIPGFNAPGRFLEKPDFGDRNATNAQFPESQRYDVWASRSGTTTSFPTAAPNSLGNIMQRNPGGAGIPEAGGRLFGQTPNFLFFANPTANDALPAPRFESVSASAFGLSSHEINPGYALSAWMPDPDGYGTAQSYYNSELGVYRDGNGLPHRQMFGRFPTEFSFDGSPNIAFGHAPSDPVGKNVIGNLFAQRELSNMELTMMLAGHTGADGQQRIAGRHGEASEDARFANGSLAGQSTPLKKLNTVANRTNDSFNSLLPEAGKSYTGDFTTDDDDDHSNLVVNALETGARHFPLGMNQLFSGLAPVTRPLEVPPNVHPLPIIGAADPFGDVDGLRRLLDLQPSAGGLAIDTAMRWPRYAHATREWFHRNYQRLVQLNGTLTRDDVAGTGVGRHGVLPYEISTVLGPLGLSDEQDEDTGASGPVNPTTFDDQYPLVGEEDESVVGVPDLTHASDALFEASENAALQLSSADFEETGDVSRLLSLMPMNLQRDPAADAIRERFTTESNDRREFHVAPTDDRPWEFNNWIFNQPASDSGASVDNSIRGFEGGGATNLVEMFPPAFNSNSVFDANDPLRRPLRLALATMSTFNTGGLFALPGAASVPRFLAAPDDQANPFGWTNILPTDTTEVNPFNFYDSNTRNFSTLTNAIAGFTASGRDIPLGRFANRHRLRFDRLLDRLDPLTGEPIYRDLTPHPDFTSTRDGFTAVTAAITIPALSHRSYFDLEAVGAAGQVIEVGGPWNPTKPAVDASVRYQRVTDSAATANQQAIAQEYWARQDRQNLARDIYTMVYMLCGPDGWNPATATPATATFAGDPNFSQKVVDHVDFAAQFAVNCVDAYDRDNVITEFQFDPDLSDGWSTLPADHQSVNGIEAQTMMLSEVLFARSESNGTDDSDTSWDDEYSHQTVMIELRNVSPFPVPLRQNSYRLEVVRDVDGTVETGAIEFDSDTADVFSAASGNLVSPGANYLIGETTAHNVSALFIRANQVDSDATSAASYDGPAQGAASDWEMIIPKGFRETIVPLTNPLPGLDLDLSFSRSGSPGAAAHDDRFTKLLTDEISDDTSASGDGVFVRYPDTGQPADTDFDQNAAEFYVRLYRRRSLNDPNGVLGTTNNDWLLVDELGYDSTDSATNTPVDFSANTLKQQVRENWQSVERAGIVGPAVLNALDDPRDYDDDTILTEAIDIRNHTLSVMDIGTATVLNADGSVNTVATPAAPNAAATRNSISPPAFSPGDDTSRFEIVDKHAANDAGDFSTNWQPHFDRDLISPSELLTIPLHGSIPISQMVAPTNLLPTAGSGPGDFDTARDNGVRVGPNGYTTDVTLAGTPVFTPERNPNGRRNVVESLLDRRWLTFSNYRWQRIFDFVEVPSRVNGPLRSREASTGQELFDVRTPGKINLNTVRHEHVLAALIDDPTHLNPLNGGGELAAPGPDVFGSPGNLQIQPFAKVNRSNDFSEVKLPADLPARNWWREFVRSRDGIDPFTHIPIPGIVGSRPFVSGSARLGDPSYQAVDSAKMREASFVHEDRTAPIQIGDVDLRGPDFLPNDDGSGNARSDENELAEMGLFEARPTTDVATNEVDPWTKNRLLAKVMNNSTERSNVFFVWVAVQLHEADHGVDASGNPDYEDVRIGAAMDDIPVYRTFCVVDRSLLEQAYEDPDPTDGLPGTFDFRKFILHRQRLR